MPFGAIQRTVSGNLVEAMRLRAVILGSEKGNICSLMRGKVVVRLQGLICAFGILCDESNRFISGGRRRCNPSYGHRRYTGQDDGHRKSLPSFGSSF